MSTVYLDTSHLSVLSKSRAEGDPAFVDFLREWRAANMELVFTRTHLVEARQHADPAVRAARYDLLEALLPIRSDIVTREPLPERPVILQQREVLRALHARQLFDVKSEDATIVGDWHRRHLNVLPERWESPGDVDAARSFESAAFGNIVQFMQDALRTEAEALSRPPGTSYDRMRLTDLPDTPFTPELTQQALESFEKILTSDDEIAALLPLLPLPVARDLLNSYIEPLRNMIRRAGEVGIRQAYLEAMGLQITPSDRRHLDNVSNELLFRHNARSAVETLTTDTELATRLAEMVSVEECPGFWLARAVSLEIRRAEPEPAPGNAYDLEHAMHAPYVEAFFADKRIAGYVNAVRKRADAIPVVAAMPAAIATAARVEALTDAVRVVAARRTTD